jgi:hypothetical protein
VEAGGREADRWGAGVAAERGEVEGMGAGAAGGGEMEAERKKSSGRSSHDEEAAAGHGEAKGFVAPPGSAIGEIGGRGTRAVASKAVRAGSSGGEGR